MLVLVASSCSDSGTELFFEVGDAEYRLKRSEVLSVTREPHQHIVIKPAGRSFDLVYDSRTAGRVDRFGWPVMPPLSRDTGDHERHTDGDLKVVCRRAGEPWGGCGFRISRAAANWSVRFPYNERERARRIREEALAVLNAYESNAGPSTD